GAVEEQKDEQAAPGLRPDTFQRKSVTDNHGRMRFLSRCIRLDARSRTIPAYRSMGLLPLPEDG
ncbi:hypothetical protein AB4043_08955, partial [Terriglobus sp. YAF25]|uniref:hypothetical protein n=1 Tax=Terriglobus sp. YAF25 TaxID=3233080 RepID=UPI003F95FDEB